MYVYIVFADSLSACGVQAASSVGADAALVASAGLGAARGVQAAPSAAAGAALVVSAALDAARAGQAAFGCSDDGLAFAALVCRRSVMNLETQGMPR